MAMVEASKAFVVIEELNARVGEKSPKLRGEAGYVTNGSAAGMLLSVARASRVLIQS